MELTTIECKYLVARNENGADIRVGDVVKFIEAGRRRRYIVTAIHCTGSVTMAALAGGYAGSIPSGHPTRELARVEEKVHFSSMDRFVTAVRYMSHSVTKEVLKEMVSTWTWKDKFGDVRQGEVW